MLLGLEEVEQVAASGEAKSDAANAAERANRSAKRRMNRGSLPAHLPRIEMVVDIEDHTCPCCGNALHRIGEDTGERLDIVPAQFRVLVVRRPKYACRACENVVVQAPAPAPADRGRIADRGDGGPGPGLQIRRSSSALPAGPDLRPPGHRSRSLDAGRLGRPRRLPAAAGPRAPAGGAEGLGQAVRRRDHGAGARSRPRAHQDRPALGLRAR